MGALCVLKLCSYVFGWLLLLFLLFLAIFGKKGASTTTTKAMVKKRAARFCINVYLSTSYLLLLSASSPTHLIQFFFTLFARFIFFVLSSFRKKNHRHNLFMLCHIVCGRETKLASYW